VKRILFVWALLLACRAGAQTGDILGAHDLSTMTSPEHGAMSAACLYCHAPHSGRNKALWNQALSGQLYNQLYTSDTVQNTGVQPVIGDRSSLCLSCHDGTVAPGQMIAYGPIAMSQPMSNGLVQRLEASHPFSLKLPLKDASNLTENLVVTGATTDATQSVKLINGNIECSSCHNPHNQFTDKKSPNFLVRDSISGGLCLSCHTTTPRTVNSLDNPLTQWTTSVHATSAAVVNPVAGLGGYSTVADFACSSCHSMHNAGGAAGLLHNPVPALPNIDPTSQSCIPCHNGSNALLTPIANVAGEFETPKKGHPYASANNAHTATEAAVLNQNRHATCVDCHNGHASQPVTAFGLPPVIRVSQTGVTGVSAADGVTLVRPAINQYETCLRCHGTSTGKGTPTIDYGALPRRAVAPADPLNILPEFALTASSTHPVMRDRMSPLPQPSLLPSMLSLDGTTAARAMGVRIFCTDCHNSDDNREFGGIGPNGPHGSKFTHILERRYEINTATAPGADLLNSYPNPDLTVNGPYALCGKCHDLSIVLSPASSFPLHTKHVSEIGASCSVCHSAHGVLGASGGITGERLVNFDINVVAPNGANPISFNQVARTCTLQCHGEGHSGEHY
jgi:predicted CXXCH cytochrome family protein